MKSSLTTRTKILSLVLVVLALAALAYVTDFTRSFSEQGSSYDYNCVAYDQIPEFKNVAPANAQPLEDFEQLKFQTVQGEEVDLQQYRGKKNVVLVITRGLTGTLSAAGEAVGPGAICTYCATQTSRLAANYPEFVKREAEIVVVFPIAKPDQAARMADFEKEAKAASKSATPLPFPFFLDVELKSVDALGIRKDLSKPATYILDREGHVRYAYVGETLIDRPSAKALLQQLDEINMTDA